ncbi:MAG TPA: sigma-54 dependent transcriptional regulator [Candidatus Binataceae bacterium]|nr:sigma-54 dependent transcriptional regulator [Candidatus Binataceae bacterium]
MTANEKRILVVEDEPVTRQAWCELIVSWGFKVAAARNGQEGFEMAHSFDPHILLADLKMPRKDGLTMLKELRESGLNMATIIISGEGDIPEAVQAMKQGAYDYLRKPVDPQHLRILLNNLAEHLNLSAENIRLRRRLMGAGELGLMVGQSLALRRVMSLIEQVAPSSASVVITGESGTGKELAARTIHELSPRRNAPYIAVNCAAIPETLMESELFGHERGAFTGADRRREGCFELANGGTLMLDEITDLKIELQAKLLRVIEEQRLRRVGGSSELEMDVRVLTACNRPLKQAIAEGWLREDLYYRLAVFSIELPPLRDRVEDIEPLTEHFINQLGNYHRNRITGMDHDCLQALKACPWPGNVRQLRNVIERALIVSNGPLLTCADLPPDLRPVGPPDLGFQVRVGSSLDDIERTLIYRTIEFAGGNKTRAAEILGVSIKTLYNRLERYEVKEKEDDTV